MYTIMTGIEGVFCSRQARGPYDQMPSPSSSWYAPAIIVPKKKKTYVVVGRVVYYMHYRYSCWTCAPRSSVHRVGHPLPAIGSCMSHPHRDYSRCLLACSRYSRSPSAASSSDPSSPSLSSPPTDHRRNHLNRLHHHHHPHWRALPLKQQRRRRRRRRQQQQQQQQALQKRRKRTRASIRSSRGASATRSRVRWAARSYTGYTRPIRAL